LISEIGNNDIKETKSPAVENYKNIKPEKEMSVKELNKAVRDEFDKAAEEAKGDSDNIENVCAEKNVDPSHKDCLTTTEERKEYANYWSRGEWDGEPGDSKFHPEKQEAKDALERYKQDGIDYTDGEPDFSKVSEATVQIEDMTSNRAYNFKQANEICAKQWNASAKDGRTDWTPRMVEEWKLKYNFSWHERLDMKTMDLVQRDVHEQCKHCGGVIECRRHEALSGGGFDE